MSFGQHQARPLLKGIFHLITTIGYVLAFPYLYDMIPAVDKSCETISNIRFSLIFYLLSIVGNFGSSTLLHIVPWNDNLVIYPRYLDHIMIFVKIAATYYATISTIMPEINPLVKYTLGFGTIFGIVLRIFFIKANKFVLGIPYLLMGWSVILDPKAILLVAERIQYGGVIAVLAGLSYTIGAFIYITQCPRIWPKSIELLLDPDRKLPKYMGYHELFHIFTIIGAVLFTVCIFGYCVPYYNRQILLS